MTTLSASSRLLGVATIGASMICSRTASIRGGLFGRPALAAPVRWRKEPELSSAVNGLSAAVGAEFGVDVA